MTNKSSSREIIRASQSPTYAVSGLYWLMPRIVLKQHSDALVDFFHTSCSVHCLQGIITRRIIGFHDDYHIVRNYKTVTSSYDREYSYTKGMLDLDQEKKFLANQANKFDCWASQCIPVSPSSSDEITVLIGRSADNWPDGIALTNSMCPYPTAEQKGIIRHETSTAVPTARVSHFMGL